MNCFSIASCFIVPCSLYLFLFLACPLTTIYIVWLEERRCCLGRMEEKQRGGGLERETLQLWREQDNRTASHMWVGGGGAHKAWGLHTVALLWRRGWDAADKVWRNGSFPQILPWEALTENTPVTVSWLFWNGPLKQAMDQSFTTVFTHTERTCLFLRPWLESK